MLFVKAKVGPSSIDGLGLIAHQFIPEGSTIWQFTPDFDVALPETSLLNLTSATREQVIRYAYRDHVKKTLLLPSDDSRFTNHADTPNTRSFNHRTIAIRDIFPGEEITASYDELCAGAVKIEADARP